MVGGRVEQGLPAGGEAVLLVKVEQGLILWFWPWRTNRPAQTAQKEQFSPRKVKHLTGSSPVITSKVSIYELSNI